MKILVAVDGSTQSTYAIQALAHFRPPEEFTLVHALTLPELDHPMITSKMRDRVKEDIEEGLRQEGNALLSQTAKEVPQDFVPALQIHQIGSPAQVILDTALTTESDLVMLGARGLGHVEELLLGSVSHRTVLHASRSTCVFKSPLSSLVNILLPIEGEEDARIAFNFLAMKPFRQMVNIQLMIVWPLPQAPWPITLKQNTLLEEHAITNVQKTLDALTTMLETLGYPASSHIGLGNPSFAILEQQKSNKADMIMMSSHGRKGLSRFFLGSVSHSVLHQAHCPVLIVR
ncbi:MAG: universal stress protein [Nitrospirales bacterium]|nr:universal stress protein [Nitrospira sp.]MDR4502528.1 universal stress protein [Nitrospirales bacterium]